MQIINNNVNTQPQTFQGLFTSRAARYAKRAKAEKMAIMLAQPEQDIISLSKGISDRKFAFFYELADKYNQKEFYKPAAERTDSLLINQMLQLVKRPTKAHFDFIEKFKGSIPEIFKILVETNGDAKAIKFVNNVVKEVFENCAYDKHSDIYPDMIIELVSSPNAKQYINNFKRYKSYLILNKDNQNLVKNLDRMIEDGSYDYKYYDSLIKIEQLKERFPLNNNSKIFDSDTYVEHFTEERGLFLDKLNKYCQLSANRSCSNYDRAVLDMFLSTNKKNIDIRRKIIRHFPQLGREDNKQEQLLMLKKLFETIDNDRHAKSFVEKIIENNMNIPRIQILNELFEHIPANKLNIFSSNVKRISQMLRCDDKFVQILKKEITNPYFETEGHKAWRKSSESYGYIRRETLFAKITKAMINGYNILRYNISNTIFGKHPLNTPQSNISTVLEDSKKTITETVRKTANAVKPAKDEIKPITEEVKQTAEVMNPAKSEVKPSTEVVKQTIGTQKPVAGEAKLITEEAKPSKSNGKEERLRQKEAIRTNIFSIISAKLGEKTVTRQREAYGNNATKMRLSLLPEIFASIADTRKIDRAVGKTRINSSNKDALELYLLINGSNKKFVNYLLKKRNIDNTRMFEVKNIIEIVKKAEAKIAHEKQTNPNYRARDARRYYNHLHEAKIEQYGKLTRAKSR